MVCYILCPECSEDLSEIFQFYSLVKDYICKDIIKNNKKIIDVDKIDLNSNVFTEFDFIFKALYINNQCCRIHILGETDMDALY